LSKILIFGGAGFIGRNIVENFVSHQEDQLVLFLKKGKAYPVESIIEKNIIIERGEISDLSLIEKIIDNYHIDTIVHLISSIIPSSNQDDFYSEMNEVVLPTMKLVDLSEKKKVKFIFFSSGGTVYGRNAEIYSENLKLEPINYYGLSKQIIENYISAKSRIDTLDFIILRPSNVYGKYQEPQRTQGFIAKAFFSIENDLILDIWGDGSTIRDYINVMDIAILIKKIIDSGVSNCSINLSTNEGVSLLELVSNIELLYEKKIELKFEAKRKVDVDKAVLSNSVLLSTVEHKFIDIKAGLRMYFEYLKKL
jgi:UDP-glucose 4-epimerase